MALFPLGLLDWAGHRSGGVRRLFYSENARPSGDVLRTPLLERLGVWATAAVQSPVGAAKVVLLVGGPGNGKTEAIEQTIAALDQSLGAAGGLSAALSRQFLAADGKPTPRLATVNLSPFNSGRLKCDLAIVQDASVADPAARGLSPAQLLVRDLENHVAPNNENLYLACINRGVLDDALIAASDGKSRIQPALEAIVRSVGMSADSPECWPLAGYPDIAVWPMDVETLIGDGNEEQHMPAALILTIATDPGRWSTFGTCPAGERCPFCNSQKLLASEPHRTSFLRLLRWHEIASGKRWSFRDLYSLLSFLLAGERPPSDEGIAYDPCAWAADLIAQSEKPSTRASLRFSAPFLLVASQYQHALFSSWPRVGLRNLRADISELELSDAPTLMGLYHFLAANGAREVPPTLASQLTDIGSLLDPAVADPELSLMVSSQTEITYRELDTRFSQSVNEGLQYVQKYRCLSTLEIDLLKRLAATDALLSTTETLRKRPATAIRVRALVRDFACRLVRRSLGTRSVVVRNAGVLADYQKVLGGDIKLMHDAVKQVEGLLNEGDHFIVTLNATFGEPLPPNQRRAVLTTPKVRVKAREVPAGQRPSLPVRFLTVGTSQRTQSIALTYDLFKSVRELRQGLLTASLPRPVVASLDTARARIAGQIVRDEDQLEGAEIQIGLRADKIVRELGRFLVKGQETE